MRRYVLGATLLFAALAAPTTASAQDGPSRTFLRLSIVTGDDDLRGGNDNVRGSYRSGETWSAPIILNRRGMRWPDRSRNVAELDVPSTATFGLNAVKLQTSFGGGMGGDNWNMDQLYIEGCSARAGRAAQCIELARHGPRRFTAERGELIVEFRIRDNDVIK